MHYFLSINARVIGHDVVAHAHGHHDLLKGGVSCPFAQTIDGAFNLTRPAFHCGQGIGGRHAEVIVTMGGEDDVLCAGHIRDKALNQARALAGGCVTDCVRNVDGGGPCIDGNFYNVLEIIPFGAGGVHRRPLDIVAKIARMADCLVDALGHLIHREVRDCAVLGRGSDKGVDARAFGVANRLPAAVDVFEIRTRKAADRGILGLLGNLGDSRKITLGGNWKACLDDINAHFVKKGRDL